MSLEKWACTLENIKKRDVCDCGTNKYFTELGIATTNSIRNVQRMKEAREVMKQAALLFRIEIENRRKD